MSNALEIKGYDQLLHWLQSAPEKVMPFILKAMRTAVRAVEENISEYPPSTAANQPGRVRTVTLHRKSGDVQVERPVGYYERGRGYWYPVMAERSLGSKLGVAYGAETALKASKRNKVKVVPTVAGYKLQKGGTSEMLGRSWTTNVSENEGAVVGEIGNRDSYAGIVQGSKEDQAQYMAGIGWQNSDDALAKSQEEIDGAFGMALQDFLATLSAAE
jgi:hypothetical protein